MGIRDILSLINAGADIVIDISEHGQGDLMSMAKAVHDKNCRLTIKNASTRGMQDLRSLVDVAKGNIILEL
ncbi:hypothetical protein Ami103574_04400 [Aminipila butyrica]|uniref:Uncharacterized protein n=1 Tax=Aminipila butyrica TaxID=433296 RepID=A0A858BWZ1_9FIRM|nr:hypothetical protein [Aminipila butyrica]QIB68606.1 hypothetical protein Ami103574_04400 [Aminipila butyrica]